MTHVTSISLFVGRLQHKCVGLCVFVLSVSMTVALDYMYRRRRRKRWGGGVYCRDAHALLMRVHPVSPDGKTAPCDTTNGLIVRVRG